jgi:hypothetical protein
MRSSRTSAAGLVALALAACGHVPVATMVRLHSFDFATFDPSALRAAVGVPDVFKPRPEGAKLVVTLTFGDAPPQTETFLLKRLTPPGDLAPLAPFAHAGATIYAFALDPADVARIRDLQAEGRRARAEHPGRNTLTIRIEANVCRLGPLPDGPILITTYIRPDEETGYLVLLRDVDLRETVRAAGKNLDAETPPCPAE